MGEVRVEAGPLHRSVGLQAWFKQAVRWASIRPEVLILVSLAIGSYGIARLLQATPNGLGLIGDSFFYVTGAENLAAGIGFGRLRGGGEFAPTTHYPPGYSLAMASFQLLGVDKLDSARWVNLGSFAVLILATAGMLRRVTGSNAAGVLASLLLGLSPVLLEVHSWVMSEALYLALSAVTIWLLSIYLDRPQRGVLLLLGAMAGATTLTRYVGVALTAAIGLALVLREGTRRRKLQDLIVFAAIALGPLLAWFARNALYTGNLANRDILWNPVGYSQLRSLGLLVLGWFGLRQFVSGRLASLGLLAILGGAGVVIGWDLWRAGKFRLRNSVEGAWIWYVLFYSAVIAASISLVDAFIAIDDRILSPVFVAAMVGLAWLVARSWHRLGALLRVLLFSGVVLLIGWNGVEQSRRAKLLSGQVLGYANPAIGTSGLIQAVRELPDVPIVSNGLSSLYFWADRYCYAIPVRTDVESGLPRPTYEAEMEVLRRRFREEGAVLVLFDPANLLPDYAPLNELVEGLTLVGRYGDGEIYSYVDEPASPDP